MTVRSAWLESTSQTREDTRLVPIGTMSPLNPLSSQSGVIAGGDPFAATGSGTMQVQIGVGRAVVQGGLTQGAYPVAVSSPVTLTLEPGDAQFARIDTVVVRIYDALYDSSGQTTATVEILRGTPASTPVAATLPAGAMRLWLIAVPAGTSAGTGGINWATALTDRRFYTSGYGGIIPKGFGTLFSGSYPGQYRDTGVLERWDGSAWSTYRPPAPAVETNNSAAAVTASTGWSVVAFEARRTNGVCSWTVNVTRTGSTIAVPADGQLEDILMCRIPLGWRPAAYTEANGSDGWGNGAPQVQTDGQIILRSWSGNGSIQAGRTIAISACYVL